MKLKYTSNALALFLFAVAAHAEETTIPELELKLQQRDNSIIELLERVEALEQRVGVRRQASEAEEEQEVPVANTDAVQSPGAVVVEEGAAERALERSLTREGALLLPSGVLEIEPGFGYSRKEDSSPGFVTIGTTTVVAEIERNSTTLSRSLALRLGLPWDSQLEISLPYRKRDVEFVTNVSFTPTDVAKQSDQGLGDWRVGFAKTLLREDLWLPDLVGRVTLDTDSGDTGGFEEIRGSLSATKRQDPLTFVGGLSYERSSSDGQIKPGTATSFNFGTYIALSPETSMSFLFAATSQNETTSSGVEIAGSDRDIGVFVIGGSTLLARGTLLHFSTTIGLTDDAEDLTLMLSLPIRLDSRLF